MNCILDNNSFSMDTRNQRLTRLLLISKNLKGYATELALDNEIVDWSKQSYLIFKKLLKKQSEDLTRKTKIFDTHQKIDLELYEKYVVLKELLITRYGIRNPLLVKYDTIGSIPSSRNLRYEKAINLIATHYTQLEISDADVLPQQMINKLEVLCKKADIEYKKASESKEESINSTKELNKVFDEDSIKIRALYNWVVAIWSKKEARILEFGFALPKSKSNDSTTPSALKEFTIDSKDKKINWNSNGDNSITEFQLAFKPIGALSEWFEIYTGKDNFINDSLATGSYKIRARNENGYSYWSKEIKV